MWVMNWYFQYVTICPVKQMGQLRGTLVHGAFLDDVFARPHCIVNELTNLLLAEDVLEMQWPVQVRKPIRAAWRNEHAIMNRRGESEWGWTFYKWRALSLPNLVTRWYTTWVVGVSASSAWSPLLRPLALRHPWKTPLMPSRAATAKHDRVMRHVLSCLVASLLPSCNDYAARKHSVPHLYVLLRVIKCIKHT